MRDRPVSQSVLMRPDYGRAWATIGVIVVVVTILALIGCTGMGVGLPSNNAFFQIRNLSSVPVRLLVEDEPRDAIRDGIPVRVTRLIDKGVIPVDGVQHWQWPFAAERGRLNVVVGRDTTRAPWLLVWSKRKWDVDITDHGFTVRTQAR